MQPHSSGLPAVPRRSRNLAASLVDALTARIREGSLVPGDRLPTEAGFMQDFGVSRTVVREALSRLQAAGLVETRHGIGTFVAAGAAAASFRIAPELLATAGEVIAVLELRIGIETEAAGLAAQRRTEANLAALRAVLAAFVDAAGDDDAVGPDFELHLEVARATQNSYFVDLMTHLGTMIIPRTRLNTAQLVGENRRDYLARVHGEHERIVAAIAGRDAEAARAAMRTHLANSRERLRRVQEKAA